MRDIMKVLWFFSLGLLGIASLAGVPLLECMVGDYAEGNGCAGLLCGIAVRTKIRMKHNIEVSHYKLAKYTADFEDMLSRQLTQRW